MNESCLFSSWSGVNSRPWQIISRNFSLADHTLIIRPEPAWQKMAQPPLNDTTQPADIEEEDKSPAVNKRWLK